MEDEQHSNLLLTASLSRALARIASALDDPDLCDSHLLYELLALEDRAKERLAAESRQPRAPDE